MTSTRANLDAWLVDARKRVRSMPLAPTAEQVGRVEMVADGIAIVSGLPGVRLDELLRFERGQIGFAATLDRDSSGAFSSTIPKRSKPATSFKAPARSYAYRWGRTSLAGSSIRLAAQSMGAMR